MKRALVLGASALIILALNQNTVSEVELVLLIITVVCVCVISSAGSRLYMFIIHTCLLFLYFQL